MKRRCNRVEFETKMTANGRRWFWHLINAYNGKIMCSGQSAGFTSKGAAVAGWRGVAASPTDGVELVFLE